MKKKLWQIKQHDEAEIQRLAGELNLLPATVKLLLNRGISDPADMAVFMDSTGEFYDPFLLCDIDRAIDRIRLACERGEKVAIYGDYDVDGVSATSILYDQLTTSMGLDCSYYIPCRVDEGYGVNNDALRQIRDRGVSLVITVDTGITAIDEVEYAKSIGLDVIVTDHHECREKLPDACAVVNPKRQDSVYPFKELAGVGVVFKLICALESGRSSMDEVLNRYCEIVAIGTIADVMPLVDENRLIVRRGLELMASTSNFGISEMLKLTSTDKRGNLRRITASTVSYGIAPRINAAGRIADANRAVEFFLAKTQGEARLIAEELCQINLRRQAEENVILGQALEKIAGSIDLENDKVIILADDQWHHGIIGIVASRITDRFNLPSILISFDGDVGKGSARSVKGINIVDLLEDSRENLLKYGGHELAAGLSLSRETLPQFITRANLYAREKLRDADTTVIYSLECELAPREITRKLYNEVSRLEPFGLGNAQPIFALRNVKLGEIISMGGGKHLKFKALTPGAGGAGAPGLPGGGIFEAVCFSQSVETFHYLEGDEADIAFNLGINEFGGQTTLQLLVRDMQPSQSSQAGFDRSTEAYTAIISGEATRVSADIVPKKEDFQAAYTFLRQNQVDGMPLSWCAKSISRASGQKIDLCKMRLILDIFAQCGLLEYTAAPNLIEKLTLTQTAGKVDLDASPLLKRLKSIRE